MLEVAALVSKTFGHFIQMGGKRVVHLYWMFSSSSSDVPCRSDRIRETVVAFGFVEPDW